MESFNGRFREEMSEYELFPEFGTGTVYIPVGLVDFPAAALLMILGSWAPPRILATSADLDSSSIVLYLRT